jgi:hypothetical protein
MGVSFHSSQLKTTATTSAFVLIGTPLLCIWIGETLSTDPFREVRVDEDLNSPATLLTAEWRLERRPAAVLLSSGGIFRTRTSQRYQVCGNAQKELARLSHWAPGECIKVYRLRSWSLEV